MEVVKPIGDGFINLYKPEGMTSFAAVARVRKLIGIKQVGHAGTLDPEARGVLPIAIGRYTRLLDYCRLTPKIYRAEVVVGSMTHSGDRDGRIVARSSGYVPSLSELHHASRFLVGDIWQTPPQVSAIKHQGVRHYAAARQGQVVWPEPRRRQIYSLDQFVVRREGFFFDVSVGRGTYIRALVRDLGFIIGLAMHLGGLERRQVGAFSVQQAISLDRLEDLSDWRTALFSWKECLGVPEVRVDHDQARLITHGDRRLFEGVSWEEGVMALSYGGALLAIVEGRPWRYRLVLGKEEAPRDA